MNPVDHVLSIAVVDALCCACPVVVAGLDGWRWRTWEVAATAVYGLLGILAVHVFTP